MVNGNNNSSTSNPLKLNNGLNNNINNNNSGINNTNNSVINNNINKINRCVVDMTNLIRYTTTNNNMNLGNSNSNSNFNFNGELLVDDRWMLSNIVILKGDI